MGAGSSNANFEQDNRIVNGNGDPVTYICNFDREERHYDMGSYCFYYIDFSPSVQKNGSNADYENSARFFNEHLAPQIDHWHNNDLHKGMFSLGWHYMCILNNWRNWNGQNQLPNGDNLDDLKNYQRSHEPDINNLSLQNELKNIEKFSREFHDKIKASDDRNFIIPAENILNNIGYSGNPGYEHSYYNWILKRYKINTPTILNITTTGNSAVVNFKPSDCYLLNNPFDNNVYVIIPGTEHYLYNSTSNSYIKPSTNNTFNLTGLTSNTDYSVFVYAQNSNIPKPLTSEHSNTVTIISSPDPLDASGISFSNITYNSCNLNIKPPKTTSTNALTYNLKLFSDSNFANVTNEFKFNNSGDNLITNLLEGTIYYYQFTATNKSSSTQPLTGSITTILQPPSINIKSIKTDSFTLIINSGTTTSSNFSYIFKLFSDSGYTNIVSETNYNSAGNNIITELTEGTTYYYKFTKKNNSVESQPLTGTVSTILEIPSATITDITTKSFTLNITSKSGENIQYRLIVYKDVDDMPCTNITFNTSSYTVYGLDPNSTYSFILTKFFEKKESSPYSSYLLTLPDKPELLSSKPDVDNFILEIAKPSGDGSVKSNLYLFIMPYTSVESFGSISTTSNVDKNTIPYQTFDTYGPIKISNLSSNTTYGYKIVNINNTGSSEIYVNNISTLPGTPSLVNVIPGINNFILQIPVEENSINLNYKLNLLNVNPKPYMTFNNLGDGNTIVGNLTQNTYYDYELMVTGVGGNSKVITGTVLTLLDIPKVNPPTIGITEFTINILQYTLKEVITYNINVSSIDSVSSSLSFDINYTLNNAYTQKVTGLTPNTLYNYEIVALNNNGYSKPFTDTVLTYPEKPIIDPIKPSIRNFTINILPQKGTGKLVYTLETSSGNSNVNSANINTYGNYNVSGLTPNTLYNITLYSTNATGRSESYIGNVTTEQLPNCLYDTVVDNRCFASSPCGYTNSIAGNTITQHIANKNNGECLGNSYTTYASCSIDCPQVFDKNFTVFSNLLANSEIPSSWTSVKPCNTINGAAALPDGTTCRLKSAKTNEYYVKDISNTFILYRPLLSGPTDNCRQVFVAGKGNVWIPDENIRNNPILRNNIDASSCDKVIDCYPCTDSDSYCTFGQVFGNSVNIGYLYNNNSNSLYLENFDNRNALFSNSSNSSNSIKSTNSIKSNKYYNEKDIIIEIEKYMVPTNSNITSYNDFFSVSEFTREQKKQNLDTISIEKSKDISNNSIKNNNKIKDKKNEIKPEKNIDYKMIDNNYYNNDNIKVYTGVIITVLLFSFMYNLFKKK
jgi:hypothetical protein